MNHASEMVLVRYALVFALGAGVAIVLDRTAGAATLGRAGESDHGQLSDRVASVSPPPSVHR